MSDSDEAPHTYSSEQLPGIVRVCGRYRVKTLLGYGAFGESFGLRRFDFTQSSSRKCLPGTGYQNGAGCRSQT